MDVAGSGKITFEHFKAAFLGIHHNMHEDGRGEYEANINYHAKKSLNMNRMNERDITRLTLSLRGPGFMRI
jgi:hypothetical protein